MKLTALFVAISLYEASAFAPAPSKFVKDTTSLDMDRREFIAAAGAALAGGPAIVNAYTSDPPDNEVVKEQRTVPNKIDVNNSPVADYMKFPGLYPTIAGKIANNGPYESVDDVLKLPLLTSAEKNKLKKYKSDFVATGVTGLDPMRGRDPYRTSFNDMKVVKVDTYP